MAFAHLHLHTEYSLLDGACRIKPLVKLAKQMGMEHLAITDHGVMYGVVDFYSACLDEGIHPVIGCEVYVAPGSRLEKNNSGRDNTHLILLCENQQGYQNLIKMVSLGFIDGYYYRPRIDMGLLEQYHEGLIAMSACLSGEIPRLILNGQYEAAKALALRFQSMMGKDNYYLEIQDHGISGEKEVGMALIRMSEETGIPLAVTNDVHYLRQSDAKAQEVLMCIQTGKTLEDENRMSMSTDQLYLKSEEEMRRLYPQVPQAVENTAKIAERCNVTFEFGKYHLPDFPVPNGEAHDQYLYRLCVEGAQRRYGKVEGEVKDRLEYEFSMIRRCGYVDYFLIVWDFVHFAKSKGIPVGPGRGSGAGSLCAYALGITGIDPLKYGLIFERFLNPERVSMPDFDIDFCYERRQEVIDYVVERYGKDHVSQIITFGTMAARLVVRDVGRVMGMNYNEVDEIAKRIPMELNMTLEKALEGSAELRALKETNEKVAQLFEYAFVLEGMPRHASTHAAGVVIGARPLTEFVPLQTNDDVITTQFPMGTIEHLGLLKMDFLGLRNLTIIDDAVKMIKETEGVTIDFDTMEMDDQETYKMLGQGDTDGVFQLESQGMRRVLTELEPSSIEDVTAVISLYRPGPMESIPRYIRGKKDPSTVVYESPVLENVLKVTYGCMVYQEQVMQIVRDMAGYSLGRSDLVRRAMAKKKKSEMDKEKIVFVEGLQKGEEWIVPGAVRLGTSKEVALDVFSKMESFAQYAFNKSHACAYAVVAYQTAYLKRHYPVEFMAACMNSAMGNANKLAGFIQYCRSHGVRILPPDVNRSRARFTVDSGAIRYGLFAVKNLGAGAVNGIISIRQEEPFMDIFDFAERTVPFGLNKRGLECLIKAGALDCLPGNRAQKLAVFEVAVDGVQQRGKGSIEGQISLFDDAETKKSVARPAMPNIPEHSARLLLMMEKEMTGVYMSGHPLDEYEAVLAKQDKNIGTFLEMAEEENWQQYDGIPVNFGAMVLEAKLKTTRSNAMMCFLKLEDLYGTIEALVFPRVYERISKHLQVDAVLRVTGKLSLREEKEPSILVDNVVPLTMPSRPDAKKLYLRLADNALMHGIDQLLPQYKGDMPVRIVTQQKVFELPSTRWITPQPALLQALEQLLGAENVKMK